MTLPKSGESNGEHKEANMDEHLKGSVNAGLVLKEVLTQGLCEQRITYGVFECAHLLETCPEQIMLCVLPDTDAANNVAVNIHQKLIEAHCWENDINVVKVDSSEKLALLLTSPEVTKQAVAVDRTGDFSCILVGFPLDEMSEADYNITKYSYLFEDMNFDVIELPNS